VTARLTPGSPGFYDGLADAVAGLYKRALTDLPPDVRGAVAAAAGQEDGAARTRLNIMVKAVRTSDETGMIVCQDTGICVFFVRAGTPRCPPASSAPPRSTGCGPAWCTR
jgi:fumarate hydratase subunit alpha/L(+)-tartrate dehydratase alpha subunit